jgi:hypothetical protein
MARREKEPELVSPAMMSGMMSALYPLRARKNGFPRFRYDFIISPGDAVGMCLYPRKDGKGMRRMLARYAEFSCRPYQEVLEEVLERNTAILIVDPLVYESLDWNHFILVAIHEYAHYLRGTVGSVYKWDLRANTFERTLGLLGEFNHRVYGKGSYKKVGPLFGDWCLWDGSHDPWAHDPLFYFILYFLERKAQEMDYFNRNAKPVYEEEP